jgi:hypothetical protein
MGRIGKGLPVFLLMLALSLSPPAAAAAGKEVREIEPGKLTGRYVHKGCAFRLRVDRFAAGGGQATARFYRRTWGRCKSAQPKSLPHHLVVLEVGMAGLDIPIQIPESKVSGRGRDRYGRYYSVRARYARAGVGVTGAQIFENPQQRIRFRLAAPPGPCVAREVQVGFAVARGCFADAGSGRLVSTRPVEVGGVRATPGALGKVFVDPVRIALSSTGPVDVRWGPVKVPGGLRALRPAQLTSHITLDGVDRALRAAGLFRRVARFQPLDFEFSWGGGGRSSSVTGSLDLKLLPLPRWVRSQFPLRGGDRRPVTLKLGAKNGLVGLDPDVFKLTLERTRIDLETGKSGGPALRLPISRIELRREKASGGAYWVTEGELDPTAGGRGGIRSATYALRLFWGTGRFWEDWPVGGGLTVGGLGKKISIGRRLEVDKLGLDLRFEPFGARALTKVGLLTKLKLPRIGEFYPLEIDAELGLLALASDSCKPLAYPLSVKGKATIPPIEKLGGTANGEVTVCGDVRGLGLGELALAGGRATGWTIGGNLSIGFLGFEIQGATFDGWVLPGSFQLTAARTANLPPFPNVFARVLLNNRAIAVCGRVSAFGHTIASPGFAYEWATGRRSIHGCDLARWELQKPEVVSSAAPGAVAVRVGSRQRRFGIRVAGTTAPPTVVVRGPGGVALRAAGSAAQVGRAGAAWRDQADRSAYVLLDRPRRGRWTIEPQAGGAPIAAVATAGARPALRPRVRVRGRGSTRTLRWRVGLARGDQVRFVERGPGVSHQLAVSRRSRGRLRFRPAPGRAGRRAVVAVVERAGVALEQRTVARFRARAPRPLPRPRGVRARARRRAVSVRWRRVRGAGRDPQARPPRTASGGDRRRHAAAVPAPDAPRRARRGARPRDRRLTRTRPRRAGALSPLNVQRQLRVRPRTRTRAVPGRRSTTLARAFRRPGERRQTRRRATPRSSVTLRAFPSRTTTPSRGGDTRAVTRVRRPVASTRGRTRNRSLAHGRAGTSTTPGVATRRTQPPAVVSVTGEPAAPIANRPPLRRKRTTRSGGASNR